MSGRFGFPKKAPSLVDLDEERWYDDPFGGGVRFLVARVDSRVHQDFTDRRLGSHPLYRRISYLSASLPREESLDGIELRRRAVAELLAEGGTLKQIRVQAIDEALVLLRGWEGLVDLDTGEPVPYSEAVARELFSVTTTFVTDEPFAGLDLGEALMQWVFTVAGDHAAERGKLLESLAKNAEPSSASAPA